MSRASWWDCNRARALLIAAAFLVCALYTQAHLLFETHLDANGVASPSIDHDHDDGDHDDHDHDGGDHDHEGPRHSPHPAGDHFTLSTAPTVSVWVPDALTLEPTPLDVVADLLLSADTVVLVLPDDDLKIPPTHLLALSRPRSPPAA